MYLCLKLLFCPFDINIVKLANVKGCSLWASQEVGHGRIWSSRVEVRNDMQCWCAYVVLLVFLILEDYVSIIFVDLKLNIFHLFNHNLQILATDDFVLCDIIAGFNLTLRAYFYFRVVEFYASQKDLMIKCAEKWLKGWVNVLSS